MDILSAAALPWLSAERGHLREALRAQRFPHSLLMLAAPGLGAEWLANWSAALLLCESPAERPCGECASCQLLRADTHPDHRAVRLEADAQQIKVDQIRALIESLTLQSYRGGYKVGVVEGAETLNANGANAFLKTLEEPTDRTVLILIAAPGHRLPATIASRCLRLRLHAPPTAVALEWLRSQPGNPAPVEALRAALMLSGGAPLRALTLDAAAVATLDAQMRDDLADLASGAADPTLLAERWLKSDPPLRLAWLENWVTGRLRNALLGGDSRQSAEPVPLPAALLKPKMRATFELLDAIREFKRLASRGLNPQSSLEALLLAGRAALAK